MNHTSNRYSAVIDSKELLKVKKGCDSTDISLMARDTNHCRSNEDLSRSGLGHSNTLLCREDSVSSKSSLPSFFKKSFDGPWQSGSMSTIYTPRPDKTLALFEKLLTALKELYDKYSIMTPVDETIERQDYSEMCSKLDDRIMMIKHFQSEYLSLLEQKQIELEKIQDDFRGLLSNKTGMASIVGDSDVYWSICRGLFINESKLERCIGKLQFQIMDLEYISKAIPSDQYELSIRLNETKGFRTRIKIEKSGHQVWDLRNFDVIPTIDDCLYVKFSEVRPLNKPAVITDRKIPFINNLIQSVPSIFSLWLSPNGTIKLKLIVQWNAMLNDPDLRLSLTSIDNKYLENSNKSDISVRRRDESTSNKYSNYRLSGNIENIFRSARVMASASNSMSNIIEEEPSKLFPKKSGIEIRHSDSSIPVLLDITSPSDIGITELKDETRMSEGSQRAISSTRNVNENGTQENIEMRPKVLMKQERIHIVIDDNLSSTNLEQVIEENCHIPEDIICKKDMTPDQITERNHSAVEDDLSPVKEEILESKYDIPEDITSEKDMTPDHITERNHSVVEDDLSPVKEEILESKCDIPEDITSEKDMTPDRITERNHTVVEDDRSPVKEEILESKYDIPDDITFGKDVPPAHVTDLENSGTVIESPRVILSESNSYLEDGNEESVKTIDNDHSIEESEPLSEKIDLLTNDCQLQESPNPIDPFNRNSEQLDLLEKCHSENDSQNSSSLTGDGEGVTTGLTDSSLTSAPPQPVDCDQTHSTDI